MSSGATDLLHARLSQVTNSRTLVCQTSVLASELTNPSHFGLLFSNSLFSSSVRSGLLRNYHRAEALLWGYVRVEFRYGAASLRRVAPAAKVKCEHSGYFTCNEPLLMSCFNFHC